MATLFYSPGVRIRIKTVKYGTIDVSDDITNGSLSLRINRPHSLNFHLANHNRKYDGVFTPNDRIVCQLKRVRWLQVFAGYLDSVPFFSAYPREVPLEASCTLKRLQYTFWDPDTTESVNWLNSLTLMQDSVDGSVVSGNLTGKAVAILTELGGPVSSANPGWPWAKDAIHMGRLPSDWINKVDALWKLLGPAYAIPASLLGIDPITGGSSAADAGSQTDPRGSGKGWGALPATQGTAIQGVEGRRGLMVVSGEPRNAPRDPWWCAMRWPFAKNDSSSPADGFTVSEMNTARDLWKGVNVLVVNSDNGKSIVLRAADWGPNDTSKAIGLSPEAAFTIGAGDNSTLLFRFAKLDSLPGTSGQPQTTEGDAAGAQVGGLAAPVARPTDVTWAPADHLTANTRAARDFIFASWPEVTNIGGWRPSDPYPDHPGGYALDVMMTNDGTAAQGDRKSLGNSIALWFISNPNVFGTKYVIWYDRIATGTKNDGAWRPYLNAADSSPNQMHMNHVHISFLTTVTTPGAPGSPWAGASPDQFEGGFSAGGPGGGATLLKTDEWRLNADTFVADALSGERAMLNDKPLFDSVQQYINTSMRDFCSAPNGDLIAWFPDYFGVYGLAGKMVVRNIELEDFTMVWTDQYLITHQFTAGSSYGLSTINQANTAFRKLSTKGIASVEHPEILEALLSVDRNDPVTQGWTNPDILLQRFGARPKFDTMDALSSDQAEFWYALHLFQRNWANQFQSQVPVTFMPEVFPGMLLLLEHYGIQFYVEGVDHSWSFGPGGGFRTTVSISSPSEPSGKGFGGLIGGLVRGG